MFDPVSKADANILHRFADSWGLQWSGRGASQTPHATFRTSGDLLQ